MKTIVAFSSLQYKGTQENQKAILQALSDGNYFKDIEHKVVTLDITFEGRNDSIEVRICDLNVFAEAWNRDDLKESPADDHLLFIKYEAVTTFNIGSV